MYKWIRLFTALFVLSPGSQVVMAGDAPTPDLKTDEQVLLFPTSAHFVPEQHLWTVPIHGWVFEPESDSVWRKALISSIASFIDLEDDSAAEKIFEERSRMFLVDNERGKEIQISINGQTFVGPPSGANGHFQFDAHIPGDAALCHDWLDLKVITRAKDQRRMTGKVQCLEDSGVSVISDIDDTIKDSDVLDKKKLMAKTFKQEFQAVDGMSHLYQLWKAKGYRFHYVSASPWQLYPALQQFLEKEGFPPGSMHLKLVRLKDSSFLNLFDPPEVGKIPAITQLMQQYPGRRFILVGDSGEKDPEIYASIAKEYPDKVLRIYIRDVRHDRQRLAETFKGIQAQKWRVFTEASEVDPLISVTDNRL